MDKEERPEVVSGDEPVPVDRAEKLSKLYSEAQAVKMSGLGAYLRARSDAAPDSGELIKLSQVVLKAIELQLKILSGQVKDEKGEGLPESLESIWAAMMEVPSLRALLGRDAIRKQILERLEAKQLEDRGEEDLTQRRRDAKGREEV